MAERTPTTVYGTASEIGRLGIGGPAARLAKVLGRVAPPSRLLVRGAAVPAPPGCEIDVLPPPVWRTAIGRTRLGRFLPRDIARERLAYDRRLADRLPAAQVALFDDATCARALHRAAELGARTVLLQHNLPLVELRAELCREERRWGGGPTWVSEELAAASEQEIDGADLVVAYSQLTEERLRARGTPGEKIRRARFGVDLERFHAGPPPATFTVTFVGFLSLRKGYADLVSAFVSAALPESRLVLHGGSSLPAHHDLVARLAAGTDVRIERGPVEPAFAHASVVVLPSISDGFGLVVLEAMASGRPVIVSEGCGAAELVEDGVDGFVVPRRDPRGITEALRRLHGDSELRIAMGVAARRKAESRPWSLFEDDMAAVVREALGEAG